MKTYIFIIGIILFGQLSLFAQSESKVDTIRIKTTAQCEMCKERIEEALTFTTGVKSSYLDIKSKYVTVIFKTSKTGYNTICTAISNAGYDADSIKADRKAYDKLPGCCKLPEDR